MQLAACRHATGFIYKGMSFGSTSKPGRITAPGFVLGAVGRQGCAQIRMCMEAIQQGRHGRMKGGNHKFSAGMFLSTQPAAEKSPVNFLLFTESAIFALPSVVLAMAKSPDRSTRRMETGGQGGVPDTGLSFLCQTNPTQGKARTRSWPNEPERTEPPTVFWPNEPKQCLSSKMLLGAQRKLHHPLQQVIRRQARKIVQYELLGVEAHEITQLQRFAP
jgi:hypothetical protein